MTSQKQLNLTIPYLEAELAQVKFENHKASKKKEMLENEMTNVSWLVRMLLCTPIDACTQANKHAHTQYMLYITGMYKYKINYIARWTLLLCNNVSGFEQNGDAARDGHWSG